MGQHSDASFTQAQTDARALMNRTENGFDANCLFQNWDKNRQINAYRELNTLQQANPNDGIPDLTLTYSERGTTLETSGGRDAARKSCDPRDVARAEAPARQPVERTRRTESRPAEVSPRELERLAHPERPAERITDLAKMAFNGDERSRLDLRKELEKLANEPNKEFRDRVLQKLVDDGTYLANPFNGKPHVVVERDGSGNPTNITFSKNLGIDKQTIPMNKSVDQQVADAQRNYVDALGRVTGGLGKFDPAGTMRAYEVLDGAEPANLRWFMLYRKDQGRPAVDLSNSPYQ